MVEITVANKGNKRDELILLLELFLKIILKKYLNI
tara:strand:- start:3177 stop:3281 length:105 start_codon:yes stop_codon:yes gene_type:complete